MSADNLHALEDWAQSLVSSLDVKARRKLLRRLATELRKANAKRIRNQQNVDGGRYEARKQPKKVEEIRFNYKDKSGNVSERKVRSARGHKTQYYWS